MRPFFYIHLFLPLNIKPWHLPYITELLIFPAACHIILPLAVIRKTPMFFSCCYIFRITDFCWTLILRCRTSKFKFGYTHYSYNLFIFFFDVIIVFYESLQVYPPQAFCDIEITIVHSTPTIFNFVISRMNNFVISQLYSAKIWKTNEYFLQSKVAHEKCDSNVTKRLGGGEGGNIWGAHLPLKSPTNFLSNYFSPVRYDFFG